MRSSEASPCEGTGHPECVTLGWRNSAVANNPASPRLRRGRPAVPPSGKPQGILAKASEPGGISPRVLSWPGGSLLLEGVRVLGILNLTPDSFYDGGRNVDTQQALDRAVQMVAEGADAIDIGGESTRPGAKPVSVEEECRRVLPVVRAVRAAVEVPIAIDTRKAEVARKALKEGADWVNDISALCHDEKMRDVVAEAQAPVILMHMRGEPRTMQHDTGYGNLLEEIVSFLGQRIEFAVSGGIPADRILVDPGIGFGKSSEGNLEILANLERFHCLGRPLLLGFSRKSFIGKILDRPPEGRLTGTLAALARSIVSGVDIVRVHDVSETMDFLRVWNAIGESTKY